MTVKQLLYLKHYSFSDSFHRSIFCQKKYIFYINTEIFYILKSSSGKYYYVPNDRVGYVIELEV